MYNIYKQGKRIAQTADKTYTISGLEADTEYTLGVSKVEGGRESAVVEVVGRTKKQQVVPLPEDEIEGLNDVSAYHIGGGYYELPNGEKVRGKEAATELLTNKAQ